MPKWDSEFRPVEILNNHNLSKNQMNTRRAPLTLCLLFAALWAQAQFDVTTKSFDLEQIDRHKGWRFYSGSGTGDGYRLKLGKSACDGQLGGGSFTYSGVAWDFEELYFDRELTYQRKEEKHFGSTLEALAYEPVWGRKFVPMPDASFTGGSTFSEPMTGDMMGKTLVTGANTGVLGMGGIGVGTAKIYSKVTGVVNQANSGQVMGTGCSELPQVSSGGSVQLKSGKGEVWIMVKAVPGVERGVVFANAAGSYQDKERLHYVLREYNGKLEMTRSIQLDFTYNNVAQMAVLDLGNGKRDFIIVMQTSNKYTQKGMGEKAPDFAEVIHIDGETLEEKYRFETTLPYTRWMVRDALLGPDGSIYLVGPAGKDNKTYMPMIGGFCTFNDANLGGQHVQNVPKQIPNYQIMRIKNGKQMSIKGTSIEEATTKLKVLSGIKSKGSLKPSFNVRTSNNFLVFDPERISRENIKYYFKNDRLILAMQPYHDLSPSGVSDHASLSLAIFDTDGGLLSFVIKPEAGYATSDELFSKDGKTLYWACYELEGLNKKVLDGHYTPAKVAGMVAANLHLAKVDLTTGNAGTVEWLGAEEWGVNAQQPILAESDEDIVFFCKSVGKKAKDSELTIVRVKK
jgi:hypothetical protein